MIKISSHLLFGAMLLVGAPALAADEHHPADGAAAPSQSINVPGPPMPSGGMMSMMGSGAMPMMGMMTDHIEGRLAFLKAELKITAAQETQWSTFAETARASATAMMGMRESMMNARGGSLPARIDETEKALTVCLRTIEKIKAAVAPLYAGFSDEQKRAADQLMTSPMGPMGMMQ
ncbi:hypothetical protein GGQ86_005341 [Xanthobacter flavus]|uniref:LTXXQ motif family protein n=3 Tax=Hyphomicrobiales TaxID=356 RepID=A0A7W9L2N6_9HYPH|nr:MULTISPECIES: Spy/CpxP family protein refolding chaperone [Hyphomicrobiales]MBB5753682.1 hypothetical protein [Prosthecomicrobium pneumaticum]MDR6336837.1 hypothetical protein [Xanthobacter flavus]